MEFRQRSYQGGAISESTAYWLGRPVIARMLGKLGLLKAIPRLLSGSFGPK
jgi:hypothetical protein